MPLLPLGLLTSFRQFLYIIKPQGPTLSSFGASLGIADGIGSNNKANTTKEGPSQKPQANQNQPPGKCICLKEHNSNCPYLNPAACLAGWTSDLEIEAKFEKAKRNPKIAKQL
ncbi:hypothetical protein EK21DRAFT_112662 [Setomelanomma holmii]|uniref:Uncharacterized protein n=1 Tax=Setomelanomma holmii TaxID=210430 RepID=A0A9P4H9E7_9PLEO|nr:hypothetical protein EK21DRAFT_112662 [Setomelanomma holmii]